MNVYILVCHATDDNYLFDPMVFQNYNNAVDRVDSLIELLFEHGYRLTEKWNTFSYDIAPTIGITESARYDDKKRGTSIFFEITPTILL